MATATKIQWTDYSSNPIKYRDKATGRVVHACVKHSAGCANCYAESIAHRFEGRKFTRADMEKVKPFACDKELVDLLKSKKLAGKKVFIGDMTDVFGEWVTDEMLNKMFAVMGLRKDVTFQVLTKRADRMAEYMNGVYRRGAINDAAITTFEEYLWWNTMGHEQHHNKISGPAWPFPNVWLGVSTENQAAADERIPHLLRVPAAVRFLSVEPLLGPIEFSNVTRRADCVQQLGKKALEGIHWVIVGGESGPSARPCEVEWIRSVVRQCKAAEVPVFVKQDSGSRPGMQGRLDDDIWNTKEFPHAK